MGFRLHALRYESVIYYFTFTDACLLGKRWIECNKLFHNEFKPTAALRFRPLQINAVHGFMRRLLVDDSNIMERVRLCV